MPIPGVNALPPNPDDAELWRLASAGDQESRQTLIERSWRLSAARLSTFAPDERDEIRQEIAESVLRALATGLSPDSNLAGFLEWRGRAEITEFVRKKMRTRSTMPLDQALDAAGPQDSPLRAAELGDLWSMVELCKEHIANPNHRTAWEQRFVQGLEPRDIAAEMGLGADLVRAWIARGAKVVRHCLERRLSGEEGVTP